MSKKLEKEKAIKLRLEGKSYSQIRNEVKVSKSTLSKWLHFFPLSNEKIRELRDNSQIRIEKCRNTKENNKRKKLENVYNEVGRDIGRLSCQRKCAVWNRSQKMFHRGQRYSTMD